MLPTPWFRNTWTWGWSRLYGGPGPAYPKNGINDHVVAGAATVNPAKTGTKAALRYQLTPAPGGQCDGSGASRSGHRRSGKRAGGVDPDSPKAAGPGRPSSA